MRAVAVIVVLIAVAAGCGGVDVPDALIRVHDPLSHSGILHAPTTWTRAATGFSGGREFELFEKRSGHTVCQEVHLRGIDPGLGTYGRAPSSPGFCSYVEDLVSAPFDEIEVQTGDATPVAYASFILTDDVTGISATGANGTPLEVAHTGVRGVIVWPKREIPITVTIKVAPDGDRPATFHCYEGPATASSFTCRR